MNRIVICFLALAFAACSTTSSTSKNTLSTLNSNGETREEIPLVNGIKVSRILFENGLRLLLVEDHSSPTFAYQTWYRVGSRDEDPGRTGLAHLFEHMMFKETKNMKDGEFDKLLEAAGAEGENAFTSRDYTAYIQELPKDKLDLIMKAEADRMVNLVINQAAFKTEREVVQNERRYRNENSPDGIMDQELFQLAFTRHPYRWPVIGYQEDLDRMSAEDALQFYHTYYSPNHATVIIVGDINPGEVIALAQKYYGPLKRQNEPARTLPEEPSQNSPRRKQLKLNIQVEKILLGYPIPAFKHADSPTLEVLQNILTGGRSSRLNRALVDSGVASSVDSFDLDNRDPSLLVVTANLQAKRHAIHAESVILREFSRLSRELVSQQELERAKNKINFSFYGGLGSNFEKAYFLGHYEAIAGDFAEGLRHHERVQNVTAEDIKRVAKKYLDPKNRTVVTGVEK